MLSKLSSIWKYSIPAWINRTRFYFYCQDIFKTPPIETKKDGILILSLVSRRDVCMYLVAAKSFYHHFKIGSFTVINDGSLSDAHIKLFKNHIPQIKIVHIDEIPNAICPKGGCWERLLFAADHNQFEQVLVLDADMLTQAAIPDVVECLKNNQSFIMGLKENQQVQTMEEVFLEEKAKYAGKNLSNQAFQFVFEARLNEITNYQRRLYLKGSGGFNAFAKSSISRGKVEGLSKEMESVFGQLWHSWGSEQIAVCCLIADTPKSKILPYPKYAIFYGKSDVDYNASAVLHFVGTHRFYKNYYAQRAARFIKSIRK
ncbi:MAG: hypothetical protein HQL24_07635 [Candidatus Omnitrophica bacterium]|nr:hypothetical protein [Candidatus Omnitrophota bacterium]